MRYQCYFIAMNYFDSICFWWMRLDLQMGLGHALSMPFILICTKPMYNIHTHTDIYMYIYIYLIQYSLIHNTGTYMHTILFIYNYTQKPHIHYLDPSRSLYRSIDIPCLAPAMEPLLASSFSWSEPPSKTPREKG